VSTPNSPVSDRRSFLARLATGSAAVAAGGVFARLGIASAETTHVDHAEHGPEFSDAWLNKLTGKHRQFFDVTSVNSGWALGFAMNFLNSNNETYKLADNNLSAVVGLRHFGVPMAFTDEIWARYKLGETLGIIDPATKAPAVRNFVFHPRAGDLPFPGMALDKLMPRGVQVTCCNVALTALSGMTSAHAGVSPVAARTEWIAHLIPGVVLVPSGVLAVNRAQEKGCTYCSGAT
jgi:intracellular sulfur oxidation DsrE/DsrF family protein